MDYFKDFLSNIPIPLFKRKPESLENIKLDYEKHKSWVAEMFEKNKPTKEFLQKKVPEYDSWHAYAGGYNEYYKIGMCDLTFYNGDIPEIYHYHNPNGIKQEVVEMGCKEVHRMMTELNKQQGWNYKIIDKCKFNELQYCYVDVIP